MSKAVAALLVSTFSAGYAARLARHQSSTPAKFISDVPVLNYHLASKQNSVATTRNGDISWIVVAEANKLADDDLEKVCKTARGCQRVGHPGRGGVPYFVVRGTERELEDVLDASPKSFRFVEPDAEVHLIPELDEGASTASWGLDRIGVPTRATEGSGAHVYVLDTGIRTSHVDFGGRAASAIDLMASDTLVECAGAAECAGDGNGHGTHCAGTAVGNTYGVASKARVHAGKVLDDGGRGVFSLNYAALDWIATYGERPAVASMSLGGPGVFFAMEVAVNSAVDSGVTVVVAGGNSNSKACEQTPAFIPTAITVGSTDSSDRRSGFSNWGSCTNIWAPGSRIVSAWHQSDDGSATHSGTSMACPHVSGAAALLLGADPKLKPADVLEKLLATAERGAISDLRAEAGDTNAFLWVGSGPAPVPAPTPAPVLKCPDFAKRPVPDLSGDCACTGSWVCSRTGEFADCPTSWGTGKFGGHYFLWTCTDCKCYETLSG